LSKRLSLSSELSIKTIMETELAELKAEVKKLHAKLQKVEGVKTSHSAVWETVAQQPNR
jgi:hypothetical protein